MKVITWNVNSLRVRMERVLALLERHQPDILSLQETKVSDADFPRAAFAQAGYHAVFFGQKTYNGVALVSKRPAKDVICGFPGNPLPDEARVVSAKIEGLRVVCAYVVNGQSVESEKYDRKLRWLEAFTRWLDSSCYASLPAVVSGDFNIAPGDRDIWDPEGWRDSVLCTKSERSWLQRILDLGFVDLQPTGGEDQPRYSWWDYRGGAFWKNHGLRIDLILATAVLAKMPYSLMIDREERKAATGPGKPSDHAPVIAEIRLNGSSV